MWPRTLFFALLFLEFHGLSVADELNAFTPPTLDHPLKVKVVVVAMFEVGADTGDVRGEFQFWVERRKLDHVISLPAAYHDVRTDGNGLIGTVTGEGTAKAATSIMALGLDPCFDFSQAYWLVAGIAGIDPNHGTVGSAVWADYFLDAGQYAAYLPSLETAFAVGNRVASELLDHWETYSIQIPGPSSGASPSPKSN